MNDIIQKVDSRETYLQDMSRYSLYVLYNRCIPDERDGLKPVQRRILYVMGFETKCTTFSTKRKSAKTVGDVMGGYHPHGDSAIYDSFKPMANWYESKVPLIVYEGNSGSIQGAPHAAMRYTETFLSKFSNECILGDMYEAKNVVDWSPTFDNHNMEPDSLPVKVPLLLINGAYSIAIGRRIDIPSHSLNDVIDATLKLLDNPNSRIELIPDPCMQCEIIKADWKKISNSGFGHYICRGIIKTLYDEKTGINTLCILSVPDLTFSDSIRETIENMVKDNKLVQIADIQDETTEQQLDLRIILKKGADANYVKQMLYKHTALQQTKRVNFEVINGTNIERMSYKAYILNFLEYRRNIKFRLYNNKLQKVKTRFHQIDTYIKILESGDVENIIHMIRKQSSMDEEYLINWLVKKINISTLQAKFVIHTEIGRLSEGYLNKYKEEQKKLQSQINEYMQFITNPEAIDNEIRRELIDIRTKYNQPRKSIIISEAEASDIPEGEFKIILTESNYVKKIQVNDPIKSFKGDNPKFILTADNSKDILLFDQNGKVFRLPVSKIEFSDKSSPGIDIRLIVKKLTSNIIGVMYVPAMEELANKTTKYYIEVLTTKGLIKRIDINDIINSAFSGTVYTKLNPKDTVKCVELVSDKCDIVVYTKNKALRMHTSDTPYLKRSTLGNNAMKTTLDLDGMAIITANTKDIVVVTNAGKFNKIGIGALERSSRNKAGSNVIKLSRGDSINSIFGCNNNNGIIRVTTSSGELVDVKISDIPLGSSVSTGNKLTPQIIKAELVEM